MKTINYKKLIKTIDPFSQDIFNLGEPLDKEELIKVLENNDYEITSLDSPKTKLTKEIAFFIHNPQEEDIVINVDNNLNEMIENGKFSIVKKILKEESIDAYVIGNKSIAKKLLDVEISTDLPEIIKKISKDNLLYAVDYKIHQKEYDNKWTDKEFVLEKLKSDYLKNREFINEELLENPEFLLDVVKLILKNHSSYSSPSTPDVKYYFTDEAITYFAENMERFNAIWGKVYGPELDSQYSTKKEDLLKKLQENLFNNNEWLLKYIDYNEKINELYKFLPFEQKIQKEIAETMILKSNSSDGLSSVPLEFFKNKEDSVKYINLVQDKCSKNRMGYYLRFEKFKDHFTTEEDVLYWIENINFSLVKDFWRSLNYKMTDKLNLALAAIKREPMIFENLTSNLKLDTNICTIYIKSGGTLEKVAETYRRYKKMDEVKKILESLNSAEAKSVITNHPLFLKSKYCPTAWKEDLNNLMLIGKSIEDINISPKKLEKFIDNNIEICYKLLDCSEKMYYQLPLNFQENKEVFKYYLKISKNWIDFNSQKLPASIWGSRELCLDLIAKYCNANSLDTFLRSHKIPKPILNDRLFITEILKKIDERTWGLKLLDINPDLKKMFETYEVTKDYEREFNTHVLKSDLSKKESTPTRRLKV